MSEYTMISSDSHVNIPIEAWQTYLDPQFRELAPRIERTDEGDFEVFQGQRKPLAGIGNMAGRKPEQYTATIRRLDDARHGAWDPVERIKDQDIDGILAEVLYFGGPIKNAQDTGLRLNSYRAYNRWLADFCSHDPKRLVGVAAIPADSPELAIAEIQGGQGAGAAGRHARPVPDRGLLRRGAVGPDVEDPRRGRLPRVTARRRPAGPLAPAGPAVHDRPGGEQAADARGHRRADLRRGAREEPRAEGHLRRGPARVDLVRPLLHGPPVRASTATGRAAS